jgi:ATP-dependent RNA helicase RhlE
LTEFTNLGLAAPIADAVHAEGYTTPTPIQAQAIPYILEGRDLLGLAATGTGKTAAFSLPILHRLSNSETRVQRGRCRALILSPTRELADQIGESIRTYGRNSNLSSVVVVGGVPYGRQTAAMNKGVDIIVATPGRLLDHIEAKHIRLDSVECLVLDEADHMLDLGFVPAIRRIVRLLPKERQNLFFSATMPKEIGNLASEMLQNPERVSVTPPSTPAERIAQSVHFVEPREKLSLLAESVNRNGHDRVLVFTRTKRGADRVVKDLERRRIGAAAIHGNKSQPQRVRALNGFKDGSTPILVATDIAARGIDVDGIDLVVNYDLPNVPETYVHRIGRTARAGNSGKALAFCCPEDLPLLKAIEKVIRRSIPVANGADNGSEGTAPDWVTAAAAAGDGRRPGGGRPASRPSRRPKKKRDRLPGSTHGAAPGTRNGKPRSASQAASGGSDGGLPAFVTGEQKRPAKRKHRKGNSPRGQNRGQAVAV